MLTELQVKLILGSAGCGKTTFLLNKVEEYIASGIRPDKIAYLSFTKKAADEAIERAIQKFKLDKKNFPFFRTIHSLAYSLANITSTEVMKKRHWDDFAKKFGIDLDANVLTAEFPSYQNHGDMCLKLYGIQKATGRELRDVWRDSDFEDLPFEVFKNFCHNLEKFKKENGLYDFPDFLDNCHIPIHIDVLIIDEAQDLTRQQWSFVRRICRPSKELLIAGDDDQAIYEWSGADLETFMGFKAEKIVLPISYRLPRSVFNLSQAIVKKITKRFNKNITPRDESGLVNYISSFSEINIRKGEWLMLARNRVQLSEYEDLCRETGVVYWRDGAWSNESSEIEAVKLYESFRNGAELNNSQVNKILAYTPHVQKVKKENVKYKYEDIKWPWPDKPNWMDALRLMSPEETSYIRELRRNSEPLTGPGRIKISTIHGAKGGEADNVLLNTGVSKRVEKHANLNLDPELRVWFVAVTRARQSLFLHGEQSLFF